jgi:hypothetical protein
MKQKNVDVAVAASTLALAAACAAPRPKWDMPTGYPASNFHTENIQQFAADIDRATGGKLKITVHDRRLAVQGQRDQARGAGWPGADRRDASSPASPTRTPCTASTPSPSWPPATPTRRSCGRPRKAATEARLAKQGMKVLYSVPWPPQGIFSAKPINQRRRPQGRQVARLQPEHQPHRRAGRRAAGDRAGRRTDPGAGHRRGHRLHDLGRHRLRQQGLGAGQVLLRHQAWLPKNLVIVSQKAFDASTSRPRRRC